MTGPILLGLFMIYAAGSLAPLRSHWCLLAVPLLVIGAVLVTP